MYHPRRSARSRAVELRQLRYHLLEWGLPQPLQPPLVLLHGWMDVAASFQFVVDQLAGERHVIAPDWRGFGRSEVPGTDCYWFPDYLADLDALLDALVPAGERVDLVGHSMGGNVAMIYAGVRPERVRHLVNLEGFGMPETRPAQAPGRLRKWLDELRAPAQLRSYASVDEVALRLRRNNPRLAADKALWLAPHWSAARDDGRWHLLGDPAHKLVNPVLYRKDEVLECWRRIEAPVLSVEARDTEVFARWGAAYLRDEYDARLAVVPRLQRVEIADSGHMLHHDQPELVARAIDAFLDSA